MVKAAISTSWQCTLLGGLLFILLVITIYQADRLHRMEASLDSTMGRACREGSYGSEAGSGGKIYVAAYSHVYSPTGLPILLESALSIRNIDPASEFLLEQIDYYDSKGKLLRRFLKEPIQMGPLQSKEFIVEKADISGGTGANFLVSWRGPGLGNSPLAEAVMIGIDPDYQISFTSVGIPLKHPTNKYADLSPVCSGKGQ